MRDRARRSEGCHEFREGMTCHGVGFDGERRIHGGGGRCVVPQRGLDEAQIDAGLQQRRGLAVSQGVDGGTLRDPTVLEGGPEGILHTVSGHGGRGGGHANAPTAWRGQEPQGMAMGFPILAE
jgi:hypothetical protein